jgi:hypothetical protein
VILLSGHATPSLRARARAARFGAVLGKPLLNHVLLDALRAILGGEEDDRRLRVGCR